jgi:glycosyltransferase involved in cell wall biosynthesis
MRTVDMAYEMLRRAWAAPGAWRRERARWRPPRSGETARVFYGFVSFPPPEAPLAGGALKCRDLQREFPDSPHLPNLLYLVSSALPPHAELIARAARRAGAQVVLNQNGVAYPAWRPRDWRRANRPLARLHRLATARIYQSEFCRLSAQRFLGPPARDGAVWLNPVDTDRFRCADPPPVPPWRLLLAGSHQFAYRVAIALRTLACLKRAGVPVQLTVAGRYLWSSTEEKARRQARGLARAEGVEDAVEWRGVYTETEAVALLQSSHVLVHPQYNDASPRLLAEALACGVPPAYSASGGSPEIVGPAAGVGVTAPLDWERSHPPAPDQLADAVRQILADYPRFRLLARRRAETALDLRPWLARHRALFERLLADVSGPRWT